jgi:uncharacterized membrane protein YbhN (UPF0104 family)
VNKKYTSIAKTSLKIIVSVGALVFVFTKIQFSEVFRVFGSSNFFLLFLALLAFAVSKLIAAFRLNLFFRAIGIRIAETENLKLYLLGMYYNLFLPGGIGGDGYKIFILNKRTDVRASKIFWAVLIDRVNGVVALCCLVVLLSYFIVPDTGISYKPYFWIAVPAGLTLFALVIRRFFRTLYRCIAQTTLLSLAVQSLQVLSAFLILKAIGGEEREFEYLFVFLISSIVAMLPVSIGGVGLRELTFLYGSRVLSLDVSLSVALSLTFYIITAFVSLWGIYFGIRTEKVFSGSPAAVANISK